MSHRSKAVIATAALLVGALFTAPAPRVDAAKNIKIEVFILSKCRFAADLLKGLLPNVKGMKDRIELELGYVGKVKGKQLTSMHGDEEVMGDILQLCAHAQGDQDKWLDFMLCQYEDRDKIPARWQEFRPVRGRSGEEWSRSQIGRGPPRATPSLVGATAPRAYLGPGQQCALMRARSGSRRAAHGEGPAIPPDMVPDVDPVRAVRRQVHQGGKGAPQPRRTPSVEADWR